MKMNFKKFQAVYVGASSENVKEIIERNYYYNIRLQNKI